MANLELTKVNHVHLIAGNQGMPGAPLLNLELLYNAEPNPASLSGLAVISQAIAPPNSRIVINNVSGFVHGLGLGKVTRVFTLSGEYWQTLTPPAIGSVRESFTATFVTDNNWQGEGTFTYGGHCVTGVPIKQLG
ncbi:MAG: DUF1842 domain-containing protein [Burkholderiales bacterium]|jgi:hypothetical protein|nr:DUF1842 domain-containing protein [Burkholderiales bacterium]